MLHGMLFQKKSIGGFSAQIISKSISIDAVSVVEEQQERTETEISASSTVQFDLAKGTSLTVIFDQIQTKGAFSIQDKTGNAVWKRDVSSSSGTIGFGPTDVQLSPGEYTLIEVYQLVANTTNTIFQAVLSARIEMGIEGFETRETRFTRQILVPVKTTYTIAINATVQNVEATFSGPLSGSGGVSGVLGSSFRLRFCKDFNPRITPIFANFSQCFHIREDSRGLADKKVFI